MTTEYALLPAVLAAEKAALEKAIQLRQANETEIKEPAPRQGSITYGKKLAVQATELGLLPGKVGGTGLSFPVTGRQFPNKAPKDASLSRANLATPYSKPVSADKPNINASSADSLPSMVSVGASVSSSKTVRRVAPSSPQRKVRSVAARKVTKKAIKAVSKLRQPSVSDYFKTVTSAAPSVIKRKGESAGGVTEAKKRRLYQAPQRDQE